MNTFISILGLEIMTDILGHVIYDTDTFQQRNNWMIFIFNEVHYPC